MLRNKYNFAQKTLVFIKNLRTFQPMYILFRAAFGNFTRVRSNEISENGLKVKEKEDESTKRRNKGQSIFYDDLKKNVLHVLSLILSLLSK